ncbi:GNAT family N-acetyltransferase [Prosthecobacter sp.]|jgi:arginyl-tRNA--protein-N-Asp/Glu arginylyltransferase|uniref:GNAT family N-acetyltransferase n=1 Tax=Prosthecobacter sp. TaxID=1965333 RepID=UPI003784FE1A
MTPVLDDAFICDSVPAEFMDRLWAAGWRHFGRYFFRYSTQPGEHGDEQTITPLRIDLSACVFTKSQRRVLRKNTDLRWEVIPALLDDDMRAMFQRHKQRFTHNIPDALENFLGEDPASGPCECRMMRVFEGERLLAASFFDVGQQAASSIYGIFDPAEHKRSLGIFTLLLEIQHCREAGLRWLYPGYATHEPSAYDYKKQFRGTEMLDWSTGDWRPLLP